ncbi:MAG: hypothetical protein JW751_14910 [Polyangiaceae bacterium]|nr:hypothetical protein [Polyangiaceae bacterium]
MRTATLAVSAGLSCVAVSGGARAEPAEDPTDEAGSQLRIVYDASDDCPDRDAFLREWLAFGDSDGSSVPDLEEGVVRVTLRRSGEEFVAHLVMVDGTGQCGAQRTLSAPSCMELVADVAAGLDLAIRDWTCPPPAEEARSPPTPVPDCPTPPVGAAPRPAAEPRRGDLGLAGGFAWFVPEQGRGAWGHALLLGYRSPRSLWGTQLGPVWSAEIQVGYWVPEVLPAGVPGTDLNLRLRLASARLSACPVEFRAGGPLAVPLCGTAEAGFVVVRVGGERQPARFWGALGFAPRLRLSTHTLFAEVEPSVAFPTMRYRIQGGREIMDWVSVGTQVRLGVRF